MALFKFTKKDNSAKSAANDDKSNAKPAAETKGKLLNIAKPDATKKPVEAKSKAPAEDEKGNTYTNLFTDEKKKEEVKDSSLLTSVFTKKKKEEEGTKKIFGSLPELEKKIFSSFKPSQKSVKKIRTIFIAIVVISLASIGFFYSELNEDFDLFSSIKGPNTIQKLQNSEAEVISLQTTINHQNYLLVNYYLQKMAYLSDTYTKVRVAPTAQFNKADVQEDILVTYENAQTKWKEPIAVAGLPKETFVTELKADLHRELNELRKEAITPTISDQIKSYNETLKLINNNPLNAFFGASVEAARGELPGDDVKLYAITTSVLDILQNDFSYLSSLKQSRIEWSPVVQELELVTKTIDPLYNTGFFEELGGIKYNSYDFDAINNRIVISGQAKRDDGTTFSLITNLMDALEKSDLFDTVENRSYPKSGSEEEGYMSTFRIDIALSPQNII